MSKELELSHHGHGGNDEDCDIPATKHFRHGDEESEAGIGRARAEASIFEAEAKGPNALAGAEISTARFGAGAMARAEIASASAKAGPLAVKVGLGFDTGASVGLDGLEVKLLGIGFSIGPKIGLTFFKYRSVTFTLLATTGVVTADRLDIYLSQVFLTQPKTDILKTINYY